MMYLQDAALATGGTAVGGQVLFLSVSTDSRAIQPGQLFVALRGDNFDGHDYVAAVAAQGAAAAMVDKAWAAANPVPLPLLVVEPLLTYRFGRVQETLHKAVSKGLRITVGYALLLMLLVLEVCHENRTV